jgi:SnoaL-like domain
VRAFADGWRAPGSVERFCDHFEPWLDPDIRLVQPQMPTAIGHRAFRERFARPLFELMPDIHGTVEGWAASGNTIYIELRLDGTVGSRKVALRTCDRISLGEDGRAIERVAHLDPLPMLKAIMLSPRAWPMALRLQLAAGRSVRS